MEMKAAREWLLSHVNVNFASSVPEACSNACDIVAMMAHKTRDKRDGGLLTRGWFINRTLLDSNIRGHDGPEIEIKVIVAYWPTDGYRG